MLTDVESSVAWQAGAEALIRNRGRILTGYWICTSMQNYLLVVHGSTLNRILWTSRFLAVSVVISPPAPRSHVLEPWTPDFIQRSNGFFLVTCWRGGGRPGIVDIFRVSTRVALL